MGCLARGRVVAALAAAMLLGFGGALAAAAGADDATVMVTDDGYVDADSGTSETVIHAGQVVTWHWSEDNDEPHSVTHDAEEPGFDSHQECSRLSPSDACGQPGDDPFTWTFEEPGTYEYFCRRHPGGVLSERMSGTIVVEEAPAEPAPSPTPTPTPAPSPDGTPDESDPEDDEAAEDGDDGAASGSDQANRSPTRTLRSSRPGPSERTDAADAADPDVAPAEPDFEPFPSPSPGDGTEVAEIGDDLAVDIPGRGGIPRGTLIAIAFATLGATIGVFTKVVVFGGLWA